MNIEQFVFHTVLPWFLLVLIVFITFLVPVVIVLSIRDAFRK